MSAPRARPLALASLLALATLACQEQLTQPGECPELCPGGTAETIEEVLQALPNGDTSFQRALDTADGGVLLVSSGVPAPADSNLAVVRFAARPDSITFRDTRVVYQIDSIVLGLGLVARDTAVRGVQLHLFRLPSSLDLEHLTFAGVSPLLTPGSLVATIAVPDTARRDSLTVTLQGSALDPLVLQPADAGKLVLGVSVDASPPVGTGVRLGTGLSNLPPVFTTYVTPITDLQGATSVPLGVGVEFNNYVTKNELVPDPSLLTVGGAPSSRALIRFPWPARLRDSVSIVRATLELTPVSPVPGLPHDPGFLEARAILADLGAKSPAVPSASSSAAVEAGTTGAVGVEVGSLVQLWQGLDPRPPALFLVMTPEAATFTEAVFGSTRAGTPPQLRVTYLRRFPFERP